MVEELFGPFVFDEEKGNHPFALGADLSGVVVQNFSRHALYELVTTASTRGVGVRERNYLLTMELVNANTGETVIKETERVRKAYN